MQHCFIHNAQHVLQVGSKDRQNQAKDVNIAEIFRGTGNEENGGVAYPVIGVAQEWRRDTNQFTSLHLGEKTQLCES